jgi:hypothetical protein
MLTRIAAALGLLVISEQALAASSAEIVGSWRRDDGRTYAEVHFRSDHSFTLFTRMSLRNPVVAIAQMGERFGTWQIVGNQVQLDSRQHGSKERSQIKMRFSVSNRSLKMQSDYDPSRTDIYSRMRLPSCQPRSSARHTFIREDLVGSWRCHYRTHESEFVFQPAGTAMLYVWDLGNRRKISDLIWGCAGTTVTMHEPNGIVSADDGFLWNVIGSSRDCLIIHHGSMTYTLRRSQGSASDQAKQ